MNIFKRLFKKPDPQIADHSIDNNTNLPKETQSNAPKECQTSPQKDQDLDAKAIKSGFNSSGTEANTHELFKQEIHTSLSRYHSSPDLTIDLNLTDDDGTILQEHEAFDFTYSEWKKIRSVADRRAILFQHWDGTEFRKLSKWQIIERFVKDRYAPQALEFQKTKITDDDFKDIRLIVALSKLYRVLDVIPQAKYYAKAAYELRPDLEIVKVEYANILHLAGSAEEREQSHQLINEVIENKIKDIKGDNIPLLNFFVFSKGYLDSSIFALIFLKEGKCDVETWEKLSDEYYWCPVFRFEHSIFLSENGATLRALAKLDSLANEFYWFKPGVLANIDAINQLRVQRNDPNLLTVEMTKMEQYVSMWNRSES